ncbi:MULTISPECIES: methionine ABC transporter permease [Aerococcus]|uniref:methionine ABC transporter permease n=1 Tax=Aerococcus urinae (strain CCUG 59500 / ACS-120-V-Col10a) TaxID=2976812 RepID=UPI000200EF48|nr:methionine ABC transporter permease [Aerococcus sp. Group 1]AEA01482.1 ABC transporter, permease protein [Aerococcus sp. Group 1]MCY3030264.1 ABC transporter permease [Aerococcus sp. Group 1]MCY3054638.1 ABC transporter permease [Aerococcus sp. Group 1]MCY3056368.1 ABC transporter permease [Aerococcus sp. Group 1]MCY3061970.1 ABC transporter permease [Aerococcus sp. Group 1]
MEFLEKIMPNVVAISDQFVEATWETLFMTVITCLFAFAIGLVIGVFLVLYMPGGLKENKAVYNVLDKVVNIGRSIPFVILIALLGGFTRLIMGTAIGTAGALVPLIVGTIPFYARQVQNALLEIDPGVIEAALAMGSTTSEIVTRVYLKEAIPGLIRVSALTVINVIGLTAMAGVVGGGGLGDLAINRGYQRYQNDVILVATLLILIMVFISQAVADRLVKHFEH